MESFGWQLVRVQKGRKQKGKEPEYERVPYDPNNDAHVKAFIGSQLFNGSMKKYIRVFLQHHLKDRDEWGFRQAMVHVSGIVKVKGGDMAAAAEAGEKDEGAILRTMKTVNQIVHDEAKSLLEQRRMDGIAAPGEKALVTAMVHSKGKSRALDGNFEPYKNKKTQVIIDEFKAGRVDIISLWHITW